MATAASLGSYMLSHRSNAKHTSVPNHMADFYVLMKSLLNSCPIFLYIKMPS